MADARVRDEWGRINALQATVAYVVGAKLTPQDFSPFKQLDKRESGVKAFHAMAKALAKAGKIPVVKGDKCDS